MLLNQSRAYDIMDQRHLDGLIAHLPINVYYLTDYWSDVLAAGFDCACFGLLPRREDAPAALIIMALETRHLVSTATWVPNIVTYTGEPTDEEQATADGGARYQGWPTRDNAPLSPLAQQWVKSVERWCTSTTPNAMSALGRAIKDAELDQSTIGVDDERLLSWMTAAGTPQVTTLYAREAFNDIRLIKTDPELDLLRRAATCNQNAVVEAMDAARLGATWNELRSVYMQAMARQGGRGVYLACGVGGLPHREIVKGEPVMFDGLGTYAQYHGDFGRSLVVGEPSAELDARVRALQTGWEATREAIRPGVSYEDIAHIAHAAVTAAGFTGEFRLPVPHALGLEHTDDPRSLLLPVGSKPNRVLEQNMVLNVDMPHTEIGWGSIHLEDTVRVTADGCEAFSAYPTELRTVPAH